jgi:hypothetical protein
LLQLKKYNPIIVVEPKEYETYKNKWQKFEYLILDKDNMGVSYAQNAIYMKGLEEDLFFIVDDDIENLYAILDKKQKTLGLDKLEEVLDSMSNVNVPLLGLSFKQIQIFAKKEYENTGRIVAFLCVKPNLFRNKIEKLKKMIAKYDVIKYRLYFDVIFAISFYCLNIERGLFYKYAFGTPKMSSNLGGCFNDYKTEQVKCANEAVRLINSKFCKLCSNHGRIEIKVQWKKLAYSNLNESLF